ncbi:MAG: hypothetical protein KKF50_05480 [Nanoarchaeota archaeon]|nr:hypothetical protein [Nanoarchaeota archaeon]
MSNKRKTAEEINQEIQENERGPETIDLRSEPEEIGDMYALGFGMNHACENDD